MFYPVFALTMLKTIKKQSDDFLSESTDWFPYETQGYRKRGAQGHGEVMV